MKDQLLTELTESIKDIKSFTKEQAPDVAKQVLEARAIELKFSIAGALLFSSLLLFFTLMLAKILPLLPEELYSEREAGGRMLAIILTSGLQIIPGAVLFNSLAEWCMLRKAPKAYLLSFLKGD